MTLHSIADKCLSYNLKCVCNRLKSEMNIEKVRLTFKKHHRDFVIKGLNSIASTKFLKSLD